MNHEVGSRRDAVFPNEEEKIMYISSLDVNKLMLGIVGDIRGPEKNTS